MNQKIRSIYRSSPKREDGGYYKYLKPGALAQLRNSRIIAKSHRLDLQARISVCRVDSSESPSSTVATAGINTTNQISGFERIPIFTGRVFSPRCPQRKKLVASRSFFFVTSPPSSPVQDSPESIRDLLNPDLLVSH